MSRDDLLQAANEPATASAVRRRVRLGHDESGSVLLLTIFYAALCLVLILLVSAATSLFLERKRLFSLADGAALVGAEAYDLGDITNFLHGPRVTVTTEDVASAVTAYLAAVPNDFEGLTVERADTVDGQSATVGLSAYWRPPLLTLLVPEGLRIAVETSARSVIS